MKLRILFSFGVFLIGSEAFGQILSVSKTIPPSPEVASIAKYTDIPVGYNTGTPVINIPLLELKSGSLQVPVSLSYNASGIRVEETPSWVGLGWNLNTSPTLSRVVRSLPDDSPDLGYMSTIYKVNWLNAMDPEDPVMWDIRFGTLQDGYNLDTEPDIFNFSAMGYSGKFSWNQDSARFIVMPRQNIKIEYNTGANGISQFILTLPNGVRCYFGISKDGQRTAYEQFVSQTSYSLSDGLLSQPSSSIAQHNTSWAVLDIEAPTAKALHYYYASESATDFSRGSENIFFQDGSGNPAAWHKNASSSRQNMNKPVLQKIEGDFGSVHFVRSDQTRQDVFSNSKALDSIVLKNNEGRNVKSYCFSYDYTTSPDSTDHWALSAFVGIARKRLRLLKLTEVGENVSLPPYRFEYSPIALPDRLSASQDYWGYYNGKDNGQMLLPRIPRFVDNGLQQGYYNELDADRRIDTNFTQAGILTKIVYPTGGSTKYYYEPNYVPSVYFNTLGGVERSDLLAKTFNFPRFIDANNPDALLYLDSFTVSDIVTRVKITSLLGGCPDVVDANCRFRIYIDGKTDPGFGYMFQTSNSFYLTLAPGDYYIKAVITNTGTPVPPFNVGLRWDERVDPNNMLAGGIRVKTIVLSDSVGNTISKSLGYHFPGNPSASSGLLAGILTHSYVPEGSSGQQLQPCIASNSATPLTTDGQTVRYLFVTEYMDSAQASFKTEYAFSNDWTSPLTVKANEHVIPPNLKEWQNGQLINKKTYETINPATYRILSEENNYYTTFRELNFLTGLHFWRTAIGALMMTPYHTNTEWYLPDSTRTTYYSYQNGVQISQETTTKTFYNASFLHAKSRTINSKGQIIENKTWYPFDYDDVAGFSFPALLNKFIMQVPVKQETSVNGKIRSGQIIKYNENGLPVDMYAYESASLNDTVVHTRNIVLESNYVLKQTIDYLQDNPVQIVENNFFNSFIWDYAGNYPVAAIKNSQVSWTGYTSFEDQSSGNWMGINQASIVTGPAPTGKKYLNQTGFNLSASGLSSGEKYLVSYWSKSGAYTVNGTQAGWPKTLLTVDINGQSWTCYEHLINGQTTITVSGTGSIDELRLYPEKAQMTTYTYEPLVGMTSQCDVNNKITYYEYDGLTRLLRIRDRDKNILKQFDYQYEVPAHNNPIWQVTGQTRCKPCPANSAYITNVLQNEEKDNNPNSPTYNQTRWTDAGTSGSCVITADWQNTATPLRCKQVSGENSGEQEQEQRDMNPCSSTYNQTRWVVTGTNTTACPLPACTTANCSGEGYKCVNNICEYGIKVFTGRREVDTGWQCVYHYEFSDGSWSSNYTVTTSDPFGCPMIDPQ